MIYIKFELCLHTSFKKLKIPRDRPNLLKGTLSTRVSGVKNVTKKLGQLICIKFKLYPHTSHLKS